MLGLSKQRTKAYLITVGALIALFVLIKGCGSFKDIASILGELNAQDTVFKTDTVVRVDTLVETANRYIPVKVYQQRTDTVVMTVERLIADTTMAVTVDSTTDKDLFIKYTAYGSLSAIGFEYRILRPDIVRTVTIDKVVKDPSLHVWAGLFSDKKISAYGPSLGLSKQKIYLGLSYDLPGKCLMYNLQYNVR